MYDKLFPIACTEINVDTVLREGELHVVFYNQIHLALNLNVIK